MHQGDRGLSHIPELPLVQNQGHCSKDSGSCNSPACLVYCRSGLLPPLGARFAPHVQSTTTLSTPCAAHPVHPLLHRPMTPIASLDRVCGCRQPRGIEHRQRFFPRRREDLFSRVPHPREALHPLTQLVALVERRLRPTAPVNQGVHVRHELTPLAPLRPPAGHVQEPLAFARFACRLTHRKRSWNHALMCCWSDLLLRALR